MMEEGTYSQVQSEKYVVIPTKPIFKIKDEQDRSKWNKANGIILTSDKKWSAVCHWY